MSRDKRVAMAGMLVAGVFLSLITLMVPQTASAAYNCFIRFKDIPGESVDDKHKDWIDVVSWSFGETRPIVPSSAGGSSAERAKMQDFKFTMRTNRASPKLFLAGAKGSHIPEVVLEVCRSDGDKSKYLEIKLENVIVSSFVSLGNSGSAQTYPMEEISLYFAKIKITYIQQKRSDGSGGGSVAAEWDVKENKGN